MRTKDFLTMSSVALGTATLTIATFINDPMEAGSDSIPAPAIAKPKLVMNGVEMTLAAAGGKTFKAGEQPSFELSAVNTLDKPSQVSVNVAMTASAPMNPMSRVISIPVQLWQEQHTLTLAPKETKTLTLTARTNLPAGNVISIVLSEPPPAYDVTLKGSDGKPVLPVVQPVSPGIVALTISTVLPKQGATAPALPAFSVTPIPAQPMAVAANATSR